MQAVILCGGKGTRLGELTKVTPKCLLRVGGQPMLTWIIERLETSGFTDIIVCAGHLGDCVGEYLNLEPITVIDAGRPMGTGGQLRTALESLEDKFLVTYGDTYLPFDYAEPMRELVGRQDCDAVLTVYKEEPGNVNVDDYWGMAREVWESNFAGFRHVDYGAIAMTRKIVEGIPYNLSISLNRVLHGYADKFRVRVVEAKEPYHTINTPEELASTDAYMRTL